MEEKLGYSEFLGENETIVELNERITSLMLSCKNNNNAGAYIEAPAAVTQIHAPGYEPPTDDSQIKIMIEMDKHGNYTIQEW